MYLLFRGVITSVMKLCSSQVQVRISALILLINTENKVILADERDLPIQSVSKKKLTLLNSLPNEKFEQFWGNWHMYGWLKVSSII